MRFVLRLLINACALWVATQLVRGVTFNGDVLPFLLRARFRAIYCKLELSSDF